MNRTLRLLFVCLLQAVWAVASAYNLKVEATPQGACSLNTSGGEYDEGSRVYLRTYGNTGYVFKGWYKGDEVISSSASFYYTMPAEDVVLQARYEYDPSVPADPAMPDTTKRYKLTLGITPNGAGSLNTSGGTYAEGTSVSLRAYVNTGYHFTGWTDEERNTLSTSTSYSYTMPGRNVHLTANYYYDPSVPANPDSMATKYTVQVKCKPVGGGSFNTSSTTASEGSSVRLYSYTNTGYYFKHWEDSEGKVLSTAQNFYYTIPHGNSVVYGVFEYDPPVPSNPGKNYWNKELGEVIVDDFSAGSLGNAVSTVIGNSSRDDVAMITVAGKMNDNDFGIANNYTNCTLLDLSRVTGITTVPSYAFDYTNLESVYLPASIETIGYKAFYECKQLSSLTVYAMVPPAVENYAFSGIPEGLVVYVPASSISQYQEAEGWKNFTFLPIQEDIRNVTVSLPEGTDASVYAQMWLELTNRKSGQRMHFVMTDRLSYTFANIIRNTSWNAVVRNQRGDVFGKIDAIDVADEDVTVAFESLQLPQNVTLTVKDAEGKDVTADTQITWTDAAGNYLSQSYSVNGLLPGNKLGYNIVLSQNLAMAYAAPSLTEYTVADSDNNIVCTLSPLQKVVVSGKVIDLTTKSAISGAVVSASQTFGGKYSKTTNVKTDAKGQYSIEVFRVPTSLAIAASDYVSQTIECDVIDAEGENVSVADVSLKSISGAVISLGFTYTKSPDNEGEEGTIESFYSDYNNVDYAIFNKTQNRSISQFNVQYPQIVLLEEVNENDVLELTVSSRTSAFVPVKATAMIDAEQRASATFDIVGLGKLKSSFAVNGNASVVGSLYDAKGKLIKTYDYSGGKLIISDLTDGNYTLVTMGSSRLFNTIYDLKQLSQTGLTKDVDYVQNSVRVESGKLSVISIAEVPTLDESKLYYTGDNTSFTVNKSSIVAGNYLTLTGHLDFKSAYSTKVSNVNLIVDLPESCSFVENSVMVGNSTSSYTFEGNRVIIPMARYTDRVRFCIIPTLGGDYAPSALAQFDIDGETITQPIGSANYTAKDLSINVPTEVAKTTIPVSGTAIGTSTIEVYDGDVLVGQTTSLANGSWTMTCELNDPYNLSTHNISAKVTTKSGMVLTSEMTVVTYNKDKIEAEKVTMLYYNPEMDKEYNIVFDLINGTVTPSSFYFFPYKSWPNWSNSGTEPKDFTFIADLSNNDTTVVNSVTIGVFTKQNRWMDLEATYDKNMGRWTAIHKFEESNLPIGVKVDVDTKKELEIDSEILEMQMKESENLQNYLRAMTEQTNTLVDSLLYMIDNNCSADEIQSLIDEISLTIGYANEPIPNNIDVKELLDNSNILLSEDLLSGILSISPDEYNKLSEYLEGISIETIENITKEKLISEGFESVECTEGTEYFYRNSDTQFQIVYLPLSMLITYELTEEQNSRSMNLIRKSNDVNDLTTWQGKVYILCDKLNFVVSSVASAVDGVIDQVSALIDKNYAQIDKNMGRMLNIEEGLTEKEINELSKVNAKLMNQIKSCQAIRTWLEKNVKNFRITPRAGVAFSLFDVYSITQGIKDDGNEIINIYYSVPDCPDDTNDDDLRNRIRNWGIGCMMFYAAKLSADIVQINSVILGVTGAVPTGGTSLSAVGIALGIAAANFTAELVYQWQFDKNKEKYQHEASNLKCSDDKCPRCHKKPCECKEPCPICKHRPCICCVYCHYYPCKCTFCPKCGKRKQFCTCKPCKKCGHIDCICKPEPTVDPIHDPSGFVYEGVFSNRLEGVTATAYYKEMVEDMYGDLHENIVKWDAEEYAQENPLFTDANGYYRWDVPQGLWQVKFEKEGYETTYSEWLPVPPPQLDINIAMKQNVQPTVKSARAFEDAVEMEFDKYMMPELLTADNIRVMAGETAVEGTVELLNEEVSYEGNEEKYASKVRFNAAAPFDATEITLMVSNRVKSYAGIRMQDDFSQTFTIEPEVREIVCESNASVVYGNSGELTVQVLPAVASAGKTVKVKSSSSMILSTDVEELTLDSEGKASLTVNGELPGAAAITYSVDGYDLSATTMVSVEQEQLIPDSPVASVASGSALLKGSSVTLSCPTSGVTIYYTTDGSCPCDAGAMEYDGTPITVSEGMTLKVMAVGKKGDESDIVTYTYTICKTDLEIPLVKGWNWVSHNRYSDLAADELMQEHVERVQTQMGEIYRDSKLGFTGHIDDVSANDGIKVYMSAEGSIKLDGDLFNPYVQPLSLKKGWNWIGYSLDKPVAIDNALADMEPEVGDYIVNITEGFSQYDGEKWVGTLGEMTPGKGYLLKSASDKAFIYNMTASDIPNVTLAKAEKTLELPWSVDAHAYPNMMCITADLFEDDCKAESDKYCIAAFCGDECRGVGEYVKGIIFLSVYGEKSVPLTFLAAERATGEVYGIRESVDFNADVLGSVKAPFAFHLGEPTGVEAPWAEGQAQGVTNLLGQKVNRTDVPGIYIINGKKVLIRNNKIK